MAINQTSPARNVNTTSVLLIFLAGIIIFIGFGVYWWRSVYSNPQRVFSGMLDSSLKLHGVTRQITQGNNGQQVDQVTQLTLSAESGATSRTVLTQPDGSTRVVTESIGTPTQDYVRYTSIQTDQKSQSGGELDFNSILGVWGSGETDEETNATNGELYGESVLGVIPFGRLDLGQRQELRKFIDAKNVYEVAYDKVERVQENGRPRYKYPVTVDAEAYIQMLKKYGELAGLNHLGELDPSSYAGQERLPFTLTVDVWSRQLTKIEYTGGDRVEVLSGHNASHRPIVPTSAISVQELQERLQSIQ